MWQKKSILFIGLMLLLILKGLGQATELSLPGAPTCATISDFDGDSKSDMAIGTDGAILIYLGNGDGSFSGPTIIPFTGLPNVIRAADVNGDGRTDLVVSDRENGKIKFLLNEYGEFSSIHTEASSRAANDIVGYDFNADGYFDMALAENNAVSIWYGLGNYDPKENAWFMPGENYPIPTGTLSALEKADFNQDGLVDLIVTAGNMLYVLTQETTGFTITAQAQTGYNPVALAIADFNQDWVLDVVVANKNSNSVGIFYGSLEGVLYSFETPIYYPVGYSPSSLAIADFNSDNCLDVVVACEGENKVYFLLGNKLGNFALSSESLSTGERPVQILTTDFDSNGKADLVTVNKGTNTLSLFKDQEFASQISFKLPEMDVKVNGEDGPLNLYVDSSNNMEVSGTLVPNDYQGLKADVYLLLETRVSGETEPKTYYITSAGIVEGETAFVEDWNIEAFSGGLLYSISTTELADQVGVGFYTLIAKLIVKNDKGITVNYVMDAVDFTLQGEPVTEFPELDIKIRKNGEGEPLDGPLSFTSQDEIEIFGSLLPHDCQGFLTDVYLTFTVTRPSGEEAETVTYSITADGGLVEGVSPLIENWYATDVPEYYLTFAAQDLINTIGTGFYSIVGKLVLKDRAGFVYYVSDSAEFGLGGRPISNPATVTVSVDTTNERVKAYVSVEANDAAGLPAFAYLWIQCWGTYQYEEDNETKTGYIFFTEQYTTEGWEVLENKKYKEDEEREDFTIDPFTVWAVADLTDYPLFDFPRSYLPYGLTCEVHAGFIIKNWDGMDYSVFDCDSFYNVY